MGYCTPHAHDAVPGHPIVANPAQSSSEQFTWPTSVVCDNRVDGNIEIPSGGTPQDVPIFHMAATLEKAKPNRALGAVMTFDYMT